MPCCDTGRNIQKYKGAAASTLQDVTDNGNTTTGDIITTSGFFIGDGSLLTGIAGASSAFSFQDTSDRGNTTSNTIQFTNTITSLTTSGNVIVAGNVTAYSFYGLGTGLSSLNADNISSGTLSNDRLGTKTGTGNIVMSANPTLSGTITGGTFSGSHSGDGSGLSSLNADNISSGTLNISRGGTNITTYATGDILIASGTNTLSTLALGADSYVLTANTTSGKPTWKSASSIGTTVATLSNTAYIIGGSYNGGGAKSWSLKASTANSTDHIVIRDDSGNVYATEYHGDYIKHAGDIDTHLGFPSDDTFTVTTGGTERMKIDSSGTTIPQYIIHNGDTNTKFGFPSDDTFTVTTGGTERMKIDSSGSVGISNTNPQDELSVGGDINLTGKIKINGSTGNATQVLTSGGSGGAMTWADAGAATNYWVRSGSSPNYIVTTPTPQSNVGISNTYEVKHTLHIGSNVIVSDTGGHDVLRVNGNVFCTNYLFGDGSKIRNLNTIRTETGANQISVGSDDGGPVLSWRERQIRYQQGADDRPVPPGYGF